MSAKENDDRFAENVGGFNGCVERGIVHRSLRVLHPVNHTTTLCGGRATATNGDTGVLSEGCRTSYAAIHDVQVQGLREAHGPGCFTDLLGALGAA